MVIGDNKHRNACSNWQSWLGVGKYTTTLISRQKNVHFGGRGQFVSLWLPGRPHNAHYHLRLICHIPSHECPALWWVCCCLHNSLFLVHFIVPPVIEDFATVLIGCEYGFLGMYDLEFQYSLCNGVWYTFTSIENLNWVDGISVIMW